MAVAVGLIILLASLNSLQALKKPWELEMVPEEVLRDGQRLLLNQNLIDEINAAGAGWVAGPNERLRHYTVNDFRVLSGTYMVPANELQEGIVRRTYEPSRKLPKNFDARERWPSCPSLYDIRDQGHCGSCWAFGAVEVLTDRFCIFGHQHAKLSANDLLSCCGFECGNGCNGGYPLYAWEYFRRRGVVTTDCDPYFDDKGCQHPGCGPVAPTPKCVKKCADNEEWGDSKHYAVSAYTVDSDPRAIMQELYENGPVEVAFSVYEDFAHYKSGVYKHVKGDLIGGHAVKLIGWGTDDNGMDYWLLANSWNKSWGEDGFFRIVRGVNECGIESNVVAGYPDTHDRHRHHDEKDTDGEVKVAYE